MATKSQRGLGKGLSALLGENTDIDSFRKPVGYVNKEVVGPGSSAAPSGDILLIPADLIEPNPFAKNFIRIPRRFSFSTIKIGEKVFPVIQKI